jgi:hypothetical protein
MCAVHFDQQLALKRIAPDGTPDPNFGMGNQSVGIGGTIQNGIRIFEPNAGSLSLRGIWPAGLAEVAGKLYVIGTQIIGGDIMDNGSGGDVFVRPLYTSLVVARWNLNGTPDNAFGLNGFQSAGFDPTPIYWSANGVLSETPTSLLAYGSASPVESRTIVRPDGTTYTNTLVRAPQPALFRIVHPTGIDFGFGVNGAAIMRMQEFAPSRLIAGVVLPNGRTRLACFATATAPSNQPATTFGGLCQFS